MSLWKRIIMGGAVVLMVTTLVVSAGMAVIGRWL